MALFTVDAEKCKRDAICVQECTARIIQLLEDAPVPVLVDGGEEFCINCGHCVAICPHEALSLNTMPAHDLQPIDKELLASPEQLEHTFKSRRSIRSYKETPLDRETIERLIEMARYAPSGHNLQNVNWLVINGRDRLDALTGIVVDWMKFMVTSGHEIAQLYHMDRPIAAWEAGMDRILRAAPHLIVAYGPAQTPASQSACTVALTQLELAAFSMGLGACWAGYFNAAATFFPPMQEALALPDGNQCYGAMMIGRPKFKYHRIPLRNPASIMWR